MREYDEHEARLRRRIAAGAGIVDVDMLRRLLLERSRRRAVCALAKAFCEQVNRSLTRSQAISMLMDDPPFWPEAGRGALHDAYESLYGDGIDDVDQDLWAEALEVARGAGFDLERLPHAE